jgi:hypothetical protein
MILSNDVQDFRRALSGNDVKGRQGCEFFRRALSDTTTENPSWPCANDREEIFETKLPYCELVTIAGVSNIPDLCQVDHDVPAAPVKGRAVRSVSATSNAKAVISIHSPHQLLIVTKEFRDLFGYTIDSEICGRALRNLYGPRTDQKTIASSIRSVAMVNSTSHSVVLYSRDGEGSVFNATFSPFLSDKDTLAGCLLELSPEDS